MMAAFKEWLIEFAYLVLAIAIVGTLFGLADVLIGGWAHYLRYSWGIPLGVGFALGKIYARRHDRALSVRAVRGADCGGRGRVLGVGG